MASDLCLSHISPFFHCAPANMKIEVHPRKKSTLTCFSWHSLACLLQRPFTSTSFMLNSITLRSGCISIPIQYNFSITRITPTKAVRATSLCKPGHANRKLTNRREHVTLTAHKSERSQNEVRRFKGRAIKRVGKFTNSHMMTRYVHQ